MNIQTRGLTVNEQFFRQLCAFKQAPTQSVGTAKVSLTSTPAVRSELIQGGPVPDLSQPVFAGPTIWQQAMTHLGKYWGYYAISAVLIIGTVYIYKQQKKIQEEISS